MTTVSIAQAKDTLPALLNAVEAGERVTITRHGRPVAELRAVEAGGFCSPVSIDLIERQLKSLPVPKTDALASLRAMRDEG